MRSVEKFGQLEKIGLIWRQLVASRRASRGPSKAKKGRMSEAAVLDRSEWLFAPDGPLSEATVAALRDDPRFPQAIRTLVGGMLALYRGNRFLNVLINDRGRMIRTFRKRLPR